MSAIKQDDLKKLGFRVDVTHYRYFPLFGKALRLPEHEIRHSEGGTLRCVLPHGGRTVLTLSRDGQSFEGEANCSPLDNFNRKVGFQIAAGRALKAALAHNGHS